MAAPSFFKTAASFRLLAALLLVCKFSARAMAFRALQQAAPPPGAITTGLLPPPLTGVPSGVLPTGQSRSSESYSALLMNVKV
jgi:hypothetical protein